MVPYCSDTRRSTNCQYECRKRVRHMQQCFEDGGSSPAARGLANSQPRMVWGWCWPIVVRRYTFSITVNTRYRHTRYRHNLVIGTKTRVYQLPPAKTSSLQALAHLVTGTKKTVLCLQRVMTSYKMLTFQAIGGGNNRFRRRFWSFSGA